MNISRIVLAIAILAARLVGQSGDPASQLPGARLALAPSETLTEPSFAKPKAETANPPVSAGGASGKQGIRPAILELKPAGDPIYLVEEAEPDADHDPWRTYRRPKVERFSRDSEGIALQGYDVVSYLGGRAEKGRKELPVGHGGTTWLFATAEHRDQFTREPERYLPAYGGFCAYSVGKGYLATADPRVFTTDTGKLYLFIGKAVRAVWEQDQSRLVRKADRNWPKLHH